MALPDITKPFLLYMDKALLYMDEARGIAKEFICKSRDLEIDPKIGQCHICPRDLTCYSPRASTYKDQTRDCSQMGAVLSKMEFRSSCGDPREDYLGTIFKRGTAWDTAWIRLSRQKRGK